MENAKIINVMIISNKRETFFLLLGDLFVFSLALFISLWIRGGNDQLWSTFQDHLAPFGLIFIAWIIVFFIAGLYDKYKTILKDSMPAIISNAQFVNSAIAVAFFYLIPYFGLAPKVVLFIDLVVSFVFVYIWRTYSHSILGLKTKEPAVLIGSGEEMRSILNEVNNNPRSELVFVLSIDLDSETGTSYIQKVLEKIKTDNIGVVVVDLKDIRIEPVLPVLYSQIFSGVKFIDMDKVYESIFDRVPLSFLQYDWFLENVSSSYNPLYYFVKRFVDILFSVVIGILFLIFLPFVYLLIKIEDGGKIFFRHERIGKNNKIIKILKFRSMSEKEKEGITKIGAILRKTRIDELPQFWNLLVGDVSLIGPRPESISLANEYEKEIPYYNIRHIIKPGLSGWAQIYQENPPKYGVDFNNTKDKLSYDLYYIKNRSLILDLIIGLKTFKELLSRRGK